VQTYLDRDIQRLFPGINQAKFRLFLQMLSNLSGAVINYANVARSLGIFSDLLHLRIPVIPDTHSGGKPDTHSS